MGEPVAWGDDGTPRSPRFDDIYRPAHGGLAQARHVFLGGCGLPGAWAGQRQWRILETGFGLGLNFLATWRAWKDDPQRPAMLHFVSIEAWPVSVEDLLRSARDEPELAPLAEELAQQWFGLAPGFHRLVFEQGHVLLTLCIGDVADMLKQQSFTADSVFLDGFDPERNPAMWDMPVLKAAARLSRRGTTVASWTSVGDVRRGLAQWGFRIEKAEGLAPKRHSLRGVFDPQWELKRPAAPVPALPGHCIVIGAGLAGAAVAASLARRGWTVDVLDAAAQPASGASALPAGLLAPHQSPDDNPLSRLSRAGVRATLQQARAHLPAGEAWQPTCVIEHRMGDKRPLPPLGDEHAVWSRDASAADLESAGLAQDLGGDTAWAHDKAAWIRPGALVAAWLAHPAITWHGNTRVRRLQRQGSAWQALGEGGTLISAAGLVVVAAAYEGAALLEGRLALRPVRGQVSWSYDVTEGLPRCPINGNGHFLPAARVDGRTAWLTGSTYGRGDTGTDLRPRDHAANLERLRGLLPAAADKLAAQFESGSVHGWAGVRCTSADRRPLVGNIEPGLWVSTAMGSRGLTFAVLSAELIAAQLHAEPLALERNLADALAARRHAPS